jgi:hypothetical protein
METDFMPAPRYNLKVSPGTGAIQAVFSEPVASNIVASAPRSADPFLVVNPYGKGTCYFFPAMFGEFYDETRPSMYPRLLAEIVDRDTIPLRVTGAPNILDLHLRMQPGRRRAMVHLVNLELGPIDEIVPARGIDIEARLPFRVKSAMALRSGGNPRVTRRGDRIALRLPEVLEYEVVVLEG